MTIEYLNRPLVEDVSYEISEDRISIRCPHTIFYDNILPKRCDKDAMLDQYRRVLQIAKAQNVKISYSRHIRRTIQERWHDYVTGRERQEQLFQELREIVSKIQQRGIHRGYSDDEEIKKANKVAAELNTFNYLDNVVHKITRLAYELQTLERQLSDRHAHIGIITL